MSQLVPDSAPGAPISTRPRKVGTKSVNGSRHSCHSPGRVANAQRYIGVLNPDSLRTLNLKRCPSPRTRSTNESWLLKSCPRGGDQTEAKPPPLSSETMPLKIALPLGSI